MTRPRAAIRRRLHLIRTSTDRGYLSIVAVIVATAVIIGLGGVLVDVGAALTARETAADVTRQAARAGADALAPGSLRQATPATIATNPPAAIAAAHRYLTQAGITGGTVTVSGRQVTVTVRCTARLSDVALAGFPGSKTLTGSSVSPLERLRDLGTSPGATP